MPIASDPRRSSPSGRVVNIATASATPFNTKKLAGFIEISDLLSCVVIKQHRTDRHQQNPAFARRAGHSLTLSRGTWFGVVSSPATVVDQGIATARSFKGQMTTPAAIATVRSAAWHKLLATKGHATGPTVTGGYIDDGFVYKLHNALREGLVPRRK